jgi:protein-S-isoprenylcysteine O-methyltransferase Ste14
MPTPRDASSPFLWPPTIYGSAALVAGCLSWFVAWPFEFADLRTTALIAGVVAFCLGGVIALAAEIGFKRAGTAVLPTRPTTAIVDTGIYRLTRNPMYLGMSLALLGAGLAFNQLWFLLVLPIAMFAVTKLAIEREEAYLAQKFGAEYLAYKGKVRRWV